MSGFCLIADLGGAPVSAAALQPMIDASCERGPDGVGRRALCAAAAAHLDLVTTTEESAGDQPLTADNGKLLLAADVRLDNRRELIAAFEGQGLVRRREPADAELLLAAYRLWGKSCPARLLGDFAFAIWDDRRRELFCARDPLGVRPLHYGRRGNRVVVASGVGAAVAGLGTDPDLNERFLRRFLAGEHQHWRSETAYRSVLRLPPAEWLWMGATGSRRNCYFRFGESERTRHRRPEEHAEEFRELFGSAVAARLRSATPVAILASGGLDSSSVACMAHACATDGLLSQPVRLYTCTFERQRHADERVYQRALWDRCDRFVTTAIPSDDGWGLREFGHDSGYRLSEPEITVDRFLWMRPLLQARADGCKVVLSGVGGDHVAGGDAYGLPYNLLDVGWTELGGELKHFRRRSHRSMPWLVAYRLLRPRLPPALRWRLSRGSVQRDQLDSKHSLLGSIPRDRVELPALSSASASARLAVLTGGLLAAQLLATDRQAAHAGVEVRMPFLDRRVVGFFLALPRGCLFAGGQEKVLLRRGMRGLLPEAVRQRQGYAHFGEPVAEGLRHRERPRVERLLKGSRLVDRGLIEEERLCKVWSDYLDGGPARDYHFRGLVKALCLEAWLRSLEGSPQGHSATITKTGESAA